MAESQGMFTTFVQTTGLKRDLSDLPPLLLSPYDTPLLNTLSEGTPEVKAMKHEWLTNF